MYGCAGGKSKFKLTLSSMKIFQYNLYILTMKFGKINKNKFNIYNRQVKCQPSVINCSDISWKFSNNKNI